MGLIHSRASKKRDKAEAALLDEQRKALRRERKAPNRDRNEPEAADGREAAQDDTPWWRQPTIGAAIKARHDRER
jgi:hypothetical protein